jgi:DNA-binding GntR family transcriptional regulator
MSAEIHALPPRRALADDVYDAVLAMLMDQTLEPGSRVSIDGIARQLDVSPTPLREALVRLEAEGLVAYSARKGYRTAELLDASELHQLYEVRMLLEPAATRLAAAQIEPTQIATLESLADAARSDDTDDQHYVGYRSFAERDAAFHRLIVECAGNPMLTESIVRLRAHTHLYRLYFRHGIAADTSDEHEAILDALREHDGPAAAAAMAAHIERSYRRLAEHVPGASATERQA